MNGQVVLAGVDRAAFVTGLALRLREAGVPVAVPGMVAFTRALEVSFPSDVASMYWSARLTLVHEPHDLVVFDEVFRAVFSEAVLAVDPHARRTGATHDAEDDALAPLPGGVDRAVTESDELPWHTLPRVTATHEASGSVRGLPELRPSAIDRLAEVPFEELDEADLALLGSWLEEQVHRWPTRRSRRLRLHPRGARIVLRQTLAASRRTGWEPLVLRRARPARRPRPVTMVSDVSQSMQAYATAYLHLMRAFARTGQAETFAFSTSLTRVTPALAHRSARDAVERASIEVVDRFGGTHLARSLRTLLTSRHGNELRGGVLVIASDGWDSDPPEMLADVMARLRRRCHRVVWLNPRAAAPGFEPLVGPMAAALPFCDDFLPAHTIRAMGDVLAAIAGDVP